MRQRQPSNAAQGCGNFAFPAEREVAEKFRLWDLAFRRSTSGGCNSTSAKITPLQHKPHSRQRLAEPFSLTRGILHFPARDRKQRAFPLFPLACLALSLQGGT